MIAGCHSDIHIIQIQMLGLSLGGTEPEGLNIEAVTIWIYKSYFLATANKSLTGINSKISIDRKTHDISQLDVESPIPEGFEKKVVCCALLGILPVLNKRFLLTAQLCKQVIRLNESPIYEIQQVGVIPFDNDEPLERNAQGNLTDSGLKTSGQNSKIINYLTYLKSYLLIEGYYFAFRYDLSLSRSAHSLGMPSKKKFLWNKNIAKNLQKLGDKRWFVGMIQGSIRNFKVTLEGGSVLDYTLITRRSWAKGGTRYNSRGIDLQGNVANFCETEQIIIIGGQCFSHLQIRGSVPCFWKQTGLYGEVEFYKSKEENEQSFRRHFQKLLRHYNKVFSINLLCKEKEGQIDLSLYYQKLVKEGGFKDLRYEYFDVHCAAKGQRFQRCNYLIDKMQNMNRYFGYYREDLSTQTITDSQLGIVRVNCLDNLDRTNLIQSKIAYQVLNHILAQMKLDLNVIAGTSSILTAADNAYNPSVLIIHLKNAWADNGDMISKHYTGTGSTHTNVTRTGKRDIKGLMDHGFKTCKRLYQQYVEDNQKQEVIDILLGEHTETVNLSQIEARLKDLNQKDEESSSTLLGYENEND